MKAGTRTYTRQPTCDILEYACEDNNRNASAADGVNRVAVPTSGSWTGLKVRNWRKTALSGVRSTGRSTAPLGSATASCRFGRSTLAATDAVANVRGVGRVDHPNDLQFDARPQSIKQPAIATEQHRNLVNLQFVQNAGL